MDENHSVIIHREPGRERGRRREGERGKLRFTCFNINLLQKGVGRVCCQWVELQEREQGRNWEQQQVMKLHLKYNNNNNNNYCYFENTRICTVLVVLVGYSY